MQASFKQGTVLCIIHFYDMIQRTVPCLGSTIIMRDNRLIAALEIAQEWKENKASVGDARKSSVAAHSVARQSTTPAVKAIARSIGHDVATAHMDDHSAGAALYARKAVFYSGKAVEAERQWQIEQLPAEIREIILILLEEKEKHFKI